MKISHEPLYQGREGLQTKPGGKEAVDTVRYEALVKTVSLLRDGELTHGDARDLLKRGWGLKLHQRSEEAIAVIVQRAESFPQLIASGGSGGEGDERLSAVMEMPAQPAVLDPLTGLLHDKGEVLAAFQEKEERDRMILMAEMQNKLIEDEADRLETMDEYKARILGISKQELL